MNCKVFKLASSLQLVLRKKKQILTNVDIGLLVNSVLLFVKKQIFLSSFEIKIQ